jgi:hypothetical protein
MFEIDRPSFAEIGATLKAIVERKNIRRYTKASSPSPQTYNYGPINIPKTASQYDMIDV